MKKFFLILCLVLLIIPTTALAATPKITYDKQTFDPTKGIYYLTGNVTVGIGDCTITADKAQVNIYSLEVHAQGNIHLIQDDIDFAGDTVDVVGNSHIAYVQGGLKFVQNDTIITADSGSFNWDSKEAVFANNVHFTNSSQSLTRSKLVYNVVDKKIVS